MTEEEILKKAMPCPFCGQPPEIIEQVSANWQPPTGMGFTYSAPEGKSIACTNIQGCGMRPSTFPAGEGNLGVFLRNWNQRPDDNG